MDLRADKMALCFGLMRYSGLLPEKLIPGQKSPGGTWSYAIATISVSTLASKEKAGIYRSGTGILRPHRQLNGLIFGKNLPISYYVGIFIKR